MMENEAVKTYMGLRFFSALFFWAIVSVNLVYQATVVGLNPLQLVLVGTLLEFCTFVFEIPTGIVADMYSRKMSVMIGVVLVGIGFMIEGLFPTFGMVLLAQFVWGGGYTFISGAREAWLADEIGQEKAGAVFMKGYQSASAGAMLGIAASMLLANVDVRLPIIIGGFFYALQAVFIAFLMPENNFRPTPPGRRETFSSMKELFIQGIGLLRGNIVLRVAIITAVMFGAFSETFDRLWTPYLIENFSFPEFANIKLAVWFAGIAMVATLLSIFAAQIFSRKTDFSNHQSTAKALIAATSLLIFGVIGFGLAQGLFAAVAMYWLASIFREMRQPLHDAWISQNTVAKNRATVFSICSQADAAGQIAGGLVLGAIATFAAIKVSIIAAGLLLVPNIFLYAYSLKKRKSAKV
jgi:DHA3 family tetracycline resistance protein-like MFS transporter